MSSQEARLRRAFAWPYPAIDPDQWYPVLRKEADEPGYCWLQTPARSVFVREEHLDLRDLLGPATAELPAQLPLQDDDPAHPSPSREARLRPDRLSRYGGILPGVWHEARELVARLRLPTRLLPGERRRTRLSPHDFEFRTREPRTPDDGG